MGWYINLVKNDLTLSSKAEAAINAISSDIGASAKDGKLVFKRDHLEHMDYMWQEKVRQVLSANKVSGEVCFSSSDGDNKGQAWGYRYVDGVESKLIRASGEWIADDGGDYTITPTGFAPTRLEDAKAGDTVVIGFRAYGTTSYEKTTVGDILPTGAIVVDGHEFSAPNWSARGGMGSTMLLMTLDNPAVELDDEDNMVEVGSTASEGEKAY
jgi:hypothetical protein